MRREAIVVVLALAAMTAVAAVAATAAKDPSTLILRKGDFPPGVMFEADESDTGTTHDALEARGIETQRASYFGMTSSKEKGALRVAGVVLTVASVQQARKGFAIAKQERDAWWKLVGEAPRRISVPSYGDQHYARHDPAGGEGIGVMELLVRTRTFIWLLNVQVERRPAAPKAQLFAELKKYALKQERRVGAG